MGKASPHNRYGCHHHSFGGVHHIYKTFPSDHLARSSCQAWCSRSNCSGASPSCVRCCCKAGTTDNTGTICTSPHISVFVSYHLHPTNYGIAKRNCPSPLLSYPGSSSSTRHSTRKLAKRLPRPAWTASGERPCQRPSRRQPRQDPGPHGENLWKAHHIDYKSTIRVHHNSRSSHKCPLHLLPTAKTSQWPSERPSLALPPCKALASSGVSTTRRLLRAQQRQQQGSKWSTFN